MPDGGPTWRWGLAADFSFGDRETSDVCEGGSLVQPVEVSGGDPLLCEGREVAHEGVAALGVELAEDVIHEVDGEFSAALFE